MSLPLIVRPMNDGELAMVLSNWKTQLADDRYRFRWGKRLDGSDFWPLVNHVIDKVTLPSCEVHVACFVSEPDTPLCWVAIRKQPRTFLYEVVYLYARHEIRKDPELAAALERELLSEIEKTKHLAAQRVAFSPYQELRRP